MTLTNLELKLLIEAIDNCMHRLDEHHLLGSGKYDHPEIEEEINALFSLRKKLVDSIQV